LQSNWNYFDTLRTTGHFGPAERISTTKNMNDEHNTLENKPKRGRPHKKQHEYVFTRRITGSAKFWEGVDWLLQDNGMTLNEFLSDCIVSIYAAKYPKEDEMPSPEIQVSVETKEKKPRKKKEQPATVDLPFSSIEFSQAWESWKQHRKEKNQTLKMSTMVLQLKKLAGLGEKRAIESIEISILQGYTGIFEAKSTQYPMTPARRPQTSDQYGI